MLVKIILTYFLLLCDSSSLTNSCNSNTAPAPTTYITNLHVHVYDCDDLQTTELGSSSLKPIRIARSDQFKRICKPISKNDLVSSAVNNPVSPRQAAGAWVYAYHASSEDIAVGLQNVLEAIHEGHGMNIVISEDFSMNHYIVVNANGNAKQEFMAAHEESKYNATGYLIASCDNILQYILKTYPATQLTLTMVSKKSSNMEYRFDLLSGGIGCFIRKLVKNNGL